MYSERMLPIPRSSLEITRLKISIALADNSSWLWLAVPIAAWKVILSPDLTITVDFRPAAIIEGSRVGGTGLGLPQAERLAVSEHELPQDIRFCLQGHGAEGVWATSFWKGSYSESPYA